MARNFAHPRRPGDTALYRIYYNFISFGSTTRFRRLFAQYEPTMLLFCSRASDQHECVCIRPLSQRVFSEVQSMFS